MWDWMCVRVCVDYTFVDAATIYYSHRLTDTRKYSQIAKWNGTENKNNQNGKEVMMNEENQ